MSMDKEENSFNENQQSEESNFNINEEEEKENSSKISGEEDIEYEEDSQNKESEKGDSEINENKESIKELEFQKKVGNILNNAPLLNHKRLKFKKARRKRRSKYDFVGTSYRCPECGNCYLSMPALNTHRKTKHDYCKSEKRGRGRPRKEFSNLTNPESLQFAVNILPKEEEIKPETRNEKLEKSSLNFFEKEERKPKKLSEIKWNFIEEKFEELYDVLKYSFYKADSESLSDYSFISQDEKIKKEEGIKPKEKSDENKVDIISNTKIKIPTSIFNTPAPKEIFTVETPVVKPKLHEVYPFFNFIGLNWCLIEKLTDVNECKKKFEDTYKMMVSENLIPNNQNEFQNIQGNFPNGCLSIQHVFLIFLKDCSLKTNETFIEKIFKFVMLLHEGLIFISKDESYCYKNTINLFPMKVNDLIEEYFQKYFFFGYTTEEVIEFFGYFCYWLRKYNFSEYKIKF